jgi:cytohesin
VLAPVNVVSNVWIVMLPIEAAARCGDADLVRLMSSRGALRRKEDVRAFLEAAVESGFPDMVTLALEHGGRVNIKDKGGVPLLSRAAASYAQDDPVRAGRFDSVRVVELLVRAGANPNAQDDNGNTPLFEANSAEVARALVNAGADPNARNADGQTPLFDRYVAEAKEILLEAGADVSARDKYGRTALFYQDRAESIKLLIAAGANVNVQDSEGDTPLENARTEEVALALMAAGARLPTDSERLAALRQKAIKEKWPELLPELK